MTPTERIKDQAAQWLVKREAARADAKLRAEFETWLRADVHHRAAYLRLEAAWRRADLLKRLRPFDGPVNADLLAPEAPDAPPRRRLPSWGALAAALALAATALVAWKVFARADWQTYETEVGGMSRVVLKDGSRINLNTDSEMRVKLSAARRQVSLVRGEAQFDVVRDAQRPFDVQAGSATVRAIGTSFSVRLRDASRVEVLVTAGQVVIEDVPMPTPTLSAGEAATVQSTGVQIERVQSDDVSRRLAWTAGWIVFEGEELADAVEEFNRYNRRRIVIANPEIATLRVGGRFQATDPDSFVAALEKSSGVNTTSADAEVIEIR
ncbi:MAG: FecR family protein [Gammaproteobacteria bacterium]